MWRHGFLSYKKFLYPTVTEEPQHYLSDVAIQGRLGRINSESAKQLFHNKVCFYDSLVARGLGDQTPQVYGTIIGGAFRPHPRGLNPPLPDLLRKTVAMKPIVGAGGRGFFIAQMIDDQLLINGKPQSTDMLGHLDDYLVQEVVEQHEYSSSIFAGSLNTMRLLTLRDPITRESFVAQAIHRFGTELSAPVDNFSVGGLSVKIDTTTGEFGEAVVKPTSRKRLTMGSHPSSGAAISGTYVPYWQEIVGLTTAAMDLFPEVDHIGWDICVGQEGPLIVEGNSGIPNPNVFQAHGPFLGDSRVKSFYRYHNVC
jgi:hypothetical protein